MIKIYNYGQVPNEEVFARENISANVEDVVADIIADVRKNGDKALFAYTEKCIPHTTCCKNNESQDTQKDISENFFHGLLLIS